MAAFNFLFRHYFVISAYTVTAIKCFQVSDQRDIKKPSNNAFKISSTILFYNQTTLATRCENMSVQKILKLSR